MINKCWITDPVTGAAESLAHTLYRVYTFLRHIHNHIL